MLHRPPTCHAQNIEVTVEGMEAHEDSTSEDSTSKDDDPDQAVQGAVVEPFRFWWKGGRWWWLNKPPQIGQLPQIQPQIDDLLLDLDPAVAADAAAAAAADATPMLAAPQQMQPWAQMQPPPTTLGAPQQMQLPSAPLAAPGVWEYDTHIVLSFDEMTASPAVSPSDVGDVEDSDEDVDAAAGAE